MKPLLALLALAVLGITLGQLAVPTLGPGQTRIDPTLAGVIRGEVHDARTGAAAEGVPIALFHPRGAVQRRFPEPWVPEMPEQDSTPLATVRAGSEGQFRFEGLGPGSYRIAALDRQPSLEARVTLTREDESAYVELTIGVGARLRGRVTDEGGAPLGGVFVYLVGREQEGRNTLRGAPDLRVETNDDGEFLLAPVLPGEVHLQAGRRDAGFSAPLPLAVEPGQDLLELRLVVPDERAAIQRAEAGGGGLGLRTRHDGLGFVISEVVPGLAADAAGLRGGDLLLSIDGRPTRNMTRYEFMTRSRGEVGTEVVLSVRRGEGAPFELRFARAALPPRR